MTSACDKMYRTSNVDPVPSFVCSTQSFCLTLHCRFGAYEWTTISDSRHMPGCIQVSKLPASISRGFQTIHWHNWGTWIGVWEKVALKGAQQTVYIYIYRVSSPNLAPVRSVRACKGRQDSSKPTKQHATTWNNMKAAANWSKHRLHVVDLPEIEGDPSHCSIARKDVSIMEEHVQKRMAHCSQENRKGIAVADTYKESSGQQAPKSTDLKIGEVGSATSFHQCSWHLRRTEQTATL